jgi:hypothetical protein
MIKIAFLGCDSTHTEAFASRINHEGSPFHGIARVVALWGEDIKEATKKASVLGIPKVAHTPEAALEDVDLAMVIGRFGESHFDAAMKALELGIPTFVDKPFTINSTLAGNLISYATQAKVPLVSSSPLRFAKEVLRIKESSADRGKCIFVTVPASCNDLGLDPRLDTAFFYGIHGLEMLLEINGFDIQSLNISYGENLIITTIQFKSGKTGVLELIRGTSEFYELGHWTPDGINRVSVCLDGSYYEEQLKRLLNNGDPCQDFVPIESTFEAVKILEEIDKGDPYRAHYANI